jgi:hypothetical protein
MSGNATFIQHHQLESLSNELRAVRYEMKPLKAADKAKTQQIKDILIGDLNLGDGYYIVGPNQLSWKSSSRNDIKQFIDELHRLGVDPRLTNSALESSRTSYTRLGISPVNAPIASLMSNVDLDPVEIAA